MALRTGWSGPASKCCGRGRTSRAGQLARLGLLQKQYEGVGTSPQRVLAFGLVRLGEVFPATRNSQLRTGTDKGNPTV